tara:strand:+ start:488 stop:1285 length:798 start_codon:yes stop_codon:yes gene_type:complete
MPDERGSGGAVVIIQARMTSTRLPGKVLLPLGSATVLDCVLRRARCIAGLDSVCLAVPEGAAHQPIVDLAAAYDSVQVTRGPEADVLKRYAMAAREVNARYVVRVTSDCPLIDPLVSGDVLAAAVSTDAYARTSFETGTPLGLDTEAMPVRILFEADAEADDPFDREHVTPFIWKRPERFGATYVDRTPDRRKWRLTLDEPADYELISAIYQELGDADPPFGFDAVEALLTAKPELLDINRSVTHTPLPDARDAGTKSQRMTNER